MDCASVRIQLNAYVDNEADADVADQIARHLRGCPECSAAREEIQALRTAVARNGSFHRAPERLKRQIRARLAAQPPSRRRTLAELPWAWINLGVATAAGVAFAVTLGLYLAQPSEAARLDQEIVASHVRALMPNHLTDVVSSDMHTVKPWFGGKIDFSPPVYDLGRDGYSLLGGRIDYLGGRPVAALSYAHRKHVLDLYIWPLGSGSLPQSHAATLQGFHVLSWIQDDLQFVAISDMNRQDLTDFASRLQGLIALERQPRKSNE